MADVTLKRLRDTVSLMADNIGKVIANDEIMGVDVLNAVLLGFIFLAAVVIIGVNIFQKKNSKKSEPKSASCDQLDQSKPADDDCRNTAVEEVFTAKKAANNQSVPNLSYGVPGVPLAKGSDNDSVQWINNVLQWFYGPKGQSSFHVLEDSWLTTLNAQSKKSSAESGIQLVFEKIDHGSNIPKLDDVFVIAESNENIAGRDSSVSFPNEMQDNLTRRSDVTVKSDVRANDVRLGVHVSGQKGDTTWSNRYCVTIDKLAGHLRIACIIEELLLIVKFEGRPDMTMSIERTSEQNSQTIADKERQELENVILDTVSSALTSSIVDLTMSRCPDFPRFQRTRIAAEPVLPVGYDSLVTFAPSGKTNRKLLVKVIKASSLGGSKGCLQPYCVVEMDNPEQKHQTSVAKSTSSPYWDEHFLFDLNDKPCELLFEIYDNSKSEGNFLGHGIVNQDELLQSPSQRQIIPLQSRALENDSVSGSLTVEFLFMEGIEVPDLSPSRNIQVETRSRLTPGGTMITTTIKKTLTPGQIGEVEVFSRIERSPEKPINGQIEPLNEMSDLVNSLPSHVERIEAEESDSDSSVMDVIAEGEEPPESHGSPVVNGVESLTDVARKEIKSKGHSSPETTTNKSILTIHSYQKSNDKSTGSPSSEQDKTATLGSASSSSSKEGTERSRDKDKKTLMGTLKRRLSFRKKRSKSMDTDGKKGGGKSDSSRSVSSDRSSARSSGHPLLGIPGGSSGQGPNDDSTRSSISESSGISSSSARTYLHESSSLVIETNENGVVKHYLIPDSLSKKNKWKKRGTKLHIYNDHVFVAVHLSGSKACQICSKVVPRRLGKQGYVCRDCHVTCHKRCHVKIDTHCPCSTVSSMEMEYVQDAKSKSS